MAAERIQSLTIKKKEDFKCRIKRNFAIIKLRQKRQLQHAVHNRFILKQEKLTGKKRVFQTFFQPFKAF